jgi:hypothetical protein
VRVLPVEDTCALEVGAIENMAKALVAKHLSEEVKPTEARQGRGMLACAARAGTRGRCGCSARARAARTRCCAMRVDDVCACMHLYP